MANRCMVTGVGTTFGNNVAHCNKKQSRTFKSNLHKKTFKHNGQSVTLTLSTKGLRWIDKYGLDAYFERKAKGAN